VLTGCRVGAGCYLATAAIALQGALIGDHARVKAGAIAHATLLTSSRRGGPWPPVIGTTVRRLDPLP